MCPRVGLPCALHPRWAAEIIPGNLLQRGSRHDRISPCRMQRNMLRTLYPVTGDDLKRIRGLWSGPLVVKGVLRAADCPVLLDYGVDGIVVSNHGGRQLDRAPATIEVLPSIVSAVDGRAEVFLDGGVRRGTDVLAALAFGARAVLVGRPYLYGLAAGGQAGVERVLELLEDELDRAMALTGFTSIAEIDQRAVFGGDG